MQTVIAPIETRQPSLQRISSNSLYKSWDILAAASKLTEPALAALRYLEFIYAGEIEAPTAALRELLSCRVTRARDKRIREALTEIKQYMERHGSFPYPLNRELDEERLIVEAVDVLQDALDECLDKNMQTKKIREALRFLVWKDGNRWDYVNFWLALTTYGGNGRWRNADAALSNIRKTFHYYL